MVCDLHVMGNQDDGVSTGVQFMENSHHFLTAFAVQGTGIGLAITERTVRLHGGSVKAQNVSGGGLEVEIRLPCGDPSNAKESS